MCSSFSHDEVRKLFVAKEINVSAEKAWEILAINFENVQASHPKISKSSYVGDYTECKVGAKRKIELSIEGDEWMIEEIVQLNEQEKTIVIKCIEVEEVPIVPNVTKSLFKIEDMGSNKSKISCLMYYQTSPAFLGGILKGKLKTRIEDYFIGIQHFANTGETVNRSNFDRIKENSEN